MLHKTKRKTITKRKKIKTNNKTRKRFTQKVIPENLANLTLEKYNTSSREKALACHLANNNKVKHFAFKVFWFILCYWKTFYPRKWKTLIGDELLEETNKNIIQKIGFTKKERDSIFIIKDKNKFFEFLDDKFFKVTSVLNNLSKFEFTFYHVNVSEKLQKKFIHNLEKLFLINDFTWKKFAKIYHSSSKTHRKSYNMFIFNIIIYGNNDDDNMSLYKKNLVYFDFIKQSLPEEKKNKDAYLKKIKYCNKSITNNDYNDYSIYDARNFYKIDKKMPYAKIMNSYNQPYLAGPSGSTSILYINLFDFYFFPKTKDNKILLLCLIIADYIPLWHTLPEILLSANIELTSYNIPNYTLDKDAVDYILPIIKPYIK
jgi:hypothetical protein